MIGIAFPAFFITDHVTLPSPWPMSIKLQTLQEINRYVFILNILFSVVCLPCVVLVRAKPEHPPNEEML